MPVYLYENNDGDCVIHMYASKESNRQVCLNINQTQGKIELTKIYILALDRPFAKVGLAVGLIVRFWKIWFTGTEKAC